MSMVEQPKLKRAKSAPSDGPVTGGSDLMHHWTYNVIAWKSCEDLAKRLQASDPEKFVFHPTKWGKFSDSKMDHIVIGGFQPRNVIARSHVFFLASFDDNDAIMSQLHALTMLCESFLRTLTIYIPYFPVATMERVEFEGEVATANTLSRVLSALPRFGSPARVMFYDLHTLQNRFYLHTGAIATLHSAIPLIKEAMAKADPPISAIAFPDEGAQKRFGKMFGAMPLVLCGKMRVGDTRQVVIQDGSPADQHVLIVDDMVKSGGTLATCAVTLKAAGALSVSAFCTHAGFPEGIAERFCKGGDRNVFRNFWLTNSNPLPVAHVRSLDAASSPFIILDLMPLIIQDLAEP